MQVEKADLFVSLVAIWQEGAVPVADFVADVYSALDRRYTNFEILLLENGPQPGVAAEIKLLLSRYAGLRHIRLTRTADAETAVMAGLDAAIGDFVVTMHADWDPPGDIVPMVERCRAGCDLVVGLIDADRGRGPIYRVFRRAYFGLVRWSIGVEPTAGATLFRAFSRHAVNLLTRVRVRRRFFTVLAADTGLETAYQRYDRPDRPGSRPRVGLLAGLRVGAAVIVHNSTAPLHLVSLVGLIGSLLSFVYSLYVITIYLVKREVMPGWTTLSLQTSGLFFLVFVMMTLLGEYLARLLEEASDRPLYQVREEDASAVMTDPGRLNVLHRADADDPAGVGRG